MDDALRNAPLLPELRRWNPFLVRPLVDRLRSEPQIGRDLLDRQDLVVARRPASLVAVPGHGRLRRWAESAAVSIGGMIKPRNRGIVSRFAGGAVGGSSPCHSLVTALVI